METKTQSKEDILKIASQLRAIISEKWPFVKEILALYRSNNGYFTEIIENKVNKLLPLEVYYNIGTCYIGDKYVYKPFLVGHYKQSSDAPFQYYIQEHNIVSIPIYQVLFGTEDNFYGYLKQE